ncbi:glycogen operon protein GlgX homolog [Salinibacterium xinjiangense]|uniref:Glycogen operon protein n=1 Tax=Salinibacterium xinjiangense TaxID=386302 RepID=A0A2C8ZXG1_9MICO|nr:glycogen debranching protein GlgX [Salinibacterium xinjiangense]GGL00978.1 glycogen operon protein GlgX homolog [Salinibacterium xinjiangense]SOE70783.1 glycogen operon protein [Salinibacterium xinjiangense]
MPEADFLADLGVTLSPKGGELRIWSASATAMELCLFDERDANWIAKRLPLHRDDADVWSVSSTDLRPGVRYSVRATGPTSAGHAFDPDLHLIDPYARGLDRTKSGDWRGYVQEPDTFDWGQSTKPQIGMDHTVMYEAHAKGISKLNPHVPEHLRGTYAGLAHESTIAYLKDLGVTTIELLPVQQFVSEQRLIKQGLTNYWGYNTLNFFTPHAAYASREAQHGGTGAVLREFKGMVKLLHEAGLEVVLDVVYNHTAEEGRTGPTTSLRGLDNRNYYRQTTDGTYVDVTGCGNSVNTATPAAQRLILDSLRYWANDVQIDGFRFDLAATLGRDEGNEFDPEHPLLLAIRDDPQLAGVKIISEPWDVGMGGWQVGRFPAGWSEWNDGYRDRMRDFWLTDIGTARATGSAPNGIGSLARRLAGSAHVFALDRGPMASVNFITAHDGFTMADLTAYNEKHNLGNGEKNRDGTDNNHSFNYGAEGTTDDDEIRDARYKAMRNLLGTLLLSAGIPMLTAGDEFGRTQRGNNNAYNQDSELTWLPWEREGWQDDLLEVARQLIEFRRDNPALRPGRYGIAGETIPSATQMDWYNKEGLSMSEKDWDSPAERTLQYLAASTPEFEELNRILLIVHGLEDDVTVTLPDHAGVSGYTLLWDSAVEDATEWMTEHVPGDDLIVAGTSMQLFRAH